MSAPAGVRRAGEPALSPSGGGERYAHVDALRAVAVLLVVLAHAGLAQVVPGATGVTVFFAISGFVITTVLLRERRRTGGFLPSAFYARRLLKLGPPFVVVVLVPTVVFAVLSSIDWRAVSAQVFFLYNWLYTDGSAGRVLPGSSVVWSLAIEEQFYIVFAVLWVLAVRSRHCLRWLTVIGTVAVVTGPVVRTVLWSQGASNTRILYGTDARVDSIGLGILAAVVVDVLSDPARLPRVRRVLASDAAVLLAVVLFLASALVRQDLYQRVARPSAETLAAALLIAYGLLRTSGRLRTGLGRLAGLRLVQVVGLASYSIYLAHLVLMRAVASSVDGLAAAVRIPLLVALGVGVGVLCWRTVEVPALAWRRRVVDHRPEGGGA